MKRYICILIFVIIALIVFISCYEIDGATFHEQGSPIIARSEQAEPIDDTQAQTISWQDAYAEKLLFYTSQPTNTMSTDWQFLLHDINQYGIPQLFILRYYAGIRDHYAVYTFLDGEVLRIKSALGLGYDSNSGIILPPGGTTGIIRVIANGVLYRYDMIALNGTVLTQTASGTFSKMVDAYAINTFHVTQEEFEDIFGVRDERVWITLHEINEANIQEIIFGWGLD